MLDPLNIFPCQLGTWLESKSHLSLSPREARAGREPERGATLIKVPPLPGPLLPEREERERPPRDRRTKGESSA